MHNLRSAFLYKMLYILEKQVVLSGFDKSGEVQNETVQQPKHMYKHTDTKNFIHFQVLHRGKETEENYEKNINECEEECSRLKKERIPHDVEHYHNSEKEAALIFVYFFSECAAAENGAEAKSEHKVREKPDEKKYPCRRKCLLHTYNVQNGKRASRKEAREQSRKRNAYHTRNYGDSVYPMALKACGRKNKSFFLQHKSPHN